MRRTLKGDVTVHDGELGVSQCVWCRHRTEGFRHCRAFPDGIPDEIADNRHDHRLPYEGDGGIRFEPEKVEVDMADVEAPDERIPMSPELALARARSHSRRRPVGLGEAIVVDADECGLDDPALVLDEVASG